MTPNFASLNLAPKFRLPERDSGSISLTPGFTFYMDPDLRQEDGGCWGLTSKLRIPEFAP